MKAEFAKAMKPVLVHEGGKVDDPRDPGGRTNQGVTQSTYNLYRKSIGKKPTDVYNMTNVERDAIYKKRYWDVVEGDQLPPGLGYVLFDGAVNSGPSQSVKWVQRAMGTRYTGKVDGQMGLMTLEAIAAFPDHDRLIAAVIERRLAFLKNLRTWGTYGKGWKRRVESVLATGQAWAAGSVGPKVEYIPGAEAKASIEDAKPLPVKAVADTATGVGGGTAVVAQTIDQSKDQLAQFSDIHFVQMVLLLLTVTGVTLAIGGLAYRWYAARKERKMTDALDLEAKPVRLVTA
jgi:lysozyme family protein